MSESNESFIKEEVNLSGAGIFALNWRLFANLSLFLKLLPLSIITIILSSVAPSVFRWYSGNLFNVANSESIAGFEISFSTYGLMLITFLAVLFRILAWAFFEMSGMWASQEIHRQMVSSMARTRTTFFDENPSGRLINRLIRDYDEVRATAIIFVGDIFNALVEVLAIGVVAAMASPWALLLMVPLFLSFGYIQFQRSAMIEHARGLSARATSDVLHRKTDLIEGREIFLLYGRADQLLERMQASFRGYVQASGLAMLIETWASFWIRISAETFSFFTVLLMIVAIDQQQISATLAGVIISSLIGVTGSIGWLDFATGLVSRSAPHLRRCFEFIDLPAEESEEGRSVLVQTEAPHIGDIVFERFSMSYRKDTPVILNEFNLRLLAGQKTALVGRTGAGKTSVIQSLLRMVYVQGGDIRIGGQSIFAMDIREWRSRFGVVPQSPYLFAGTIRSNLDRGGTLDDCVLKKSLESVGLSLTLDYAVSEGGQNLSVGERQLICLARVLASGKKMILMDEPTSGLDPRTDAQVSEILRTVLRDKTVITVAHRRESLGSYDQVIEL